MALVALVVATYLRVLARASGPFVLQSMYVLIIDIEKSNNLLLGASSKFILTVIPI